MDSSNETEVGGEPHLWKCHRVLGPDELPTAHFKVGGELLVRETTGFEKMRESVPTF